MSASHNQLRRKHLRTAAWAGAVILWGGIVAFAGAKLLKHSATPGVPAAATRDQRPGGSINFSPDRPTLLLFCHPKCPCTRATVRELEKLIARTQGGFDTIAIFVKPGGVDDAWVQTDTWRAAGALPATRVVIDRDGALAREFGVFTSGQVMLYGPDRQLLFKGGLTSSRGHEGNTDGSDAIANYLLHNMPITTLDAPVFGCALRAHLSTTRPATVAEVR